MLGVEHCDKNLILEKCPRKRSMYFLILQLRGLSAPKEILIPHIVDI